MQTDRRRNTNRSLRPDRKPRHMFHLSCSRYPLPPPPSLPPHLLLTCPSGRHRPSLVLGQASCTLCFRSGALPHPFPRPLLPCSVLRQTRVSQRLEKPESMSEHLSPWLTCMKPSSLPPPALPSPFPPTLTPPLPSPRPPFFSLSSSFSSSTAATASSSSSAFPSSSFSSF